jgi:excinuclease ABC subunit C
MAIPDFIRIKDDELPAKPGVYFMKDADGKLLYIGKATSLKTRVGSYFTRPADQRIASMVTKIRAIDYEVTPTTIEALILEANLIKHRQPPYNVMEKDDKSWVYLAFTKEDFPQPVLIRGHELARMPKKGFLKTFGPFRSASSVRASLDTLRKSFPWTTCKPGRSRACFYRHLRLCPGVCTGEIGRKEYRVIIARLMQFFEGKRVAVVKGMQRAMRTAAKARRYEDAAELRDRLYALEHIRDIAVLKNEDLPMARSVDLFGRIEGYDISNIGGKQAVGSMVVFEDGEPAKKEYRGFGIKWVQGSNDVAMMEEVLYRRFLNKWRKPDLLLIDGGLGQLNAARSALRRHGLDISMVGIAKGPNRDKDELVFDRGDAELTRLVTAFKPVLLRVRDEAHRFAISFHRRKRGKKFLEG